MALFPLVGVEPLFGSWLDLSPLSVVWGSIDTDCCTNELLCPLLFLNMGVFFNAAFCSDLFPLIPEFVCIESAVYFLVKWDAARSSSSLY